jgi:hypothetical protein
VAYKVDGAPSVGARRAEAVPVNSQSPWKPQRDFETVRRDLEQPSRIDTRYVVCLVVIVLTLCTAVVTNLA